jgi:large subunit ribosomal protein L9
MKVILLKDHPELGNQGEVVNTSDGYARNFLLPRGIAEEATPGALRSLEMKKASWKKKEDHELAEAQKVGALLDGKLLEVTAEAGESGKLFGSVTTQDIIEAIAAKFKVPLEKKRLLLEEPIRTIGKHMVPIKLHRELTIGIELEVKAKE